MLTMKTELGYIPMVRMETIREEAKKMATSDNIRDAIDKATEQDVINFVGIRENEETCRDCGINIGSVDPN